MKKYKSFHIAVRLLYCSITWGTTCNALCAELVFDSTVIEGKALPVAEQYPFSFAFTNKGNHNIKITSISASCGCTSYALTKKVYEPNKSGMIEGKVDFKGKQNGSFNTLTITTDSEHQEKITLRLKISELKLLKIYPKVLVWIRGDEIKPKTIRIVPDENHNVSVDNVTAIGNHFKVIDLETGADGSVTASIAPIDTSNVTHSVISVGTRIDGEVVGKYSAYVVIKK